MKRKILALKFVIMISTSALFGCSENDNNGKDSTLQSGITTNDNNVTSIEKFDIQVNYSDKEKLSLSKGELDQYDNIINLDNETITISQSGEYVLSGNIDDGQIIVDVPDEDTEVVTLILNGVSITSKNSASIYVKNADKVVLSIVEGTINTFSDGLDYVYNDEEAEEPNACIFSKDDLVISGKGALIVKGNFNNGIYSKDDLTITGGDIEVTAENNGIKGKDSIAILDSEIKINANGDGMCTSNAEDEGKGFVLIENGTFNITAGEDAIQAETCLEILDGSFELTTGEGGKTTSWGNDDQWAKLDLGGGYSDKFNRENNENNSPTADMVSKKAIKAGVDITISSGEFNINSEDDAMHTNGSMTINNGTINIKSGDDGMHADNTLVINNGEINIMQCYEGIEATYITVNDGNIHVISSDDGFNAAGGNDSSSNTQRPGRNNFEGGTGSIEYNGGYIYVNANGDGLDSNGELAINGGYIIVDGPANGGNGAFDYGSSCKMTDGFIIAVGYSQMAQMPNDTSVNSVMIGFENEITAGTLVNISDANGDSVITFSSAKSYNNMVLCTPLLKTDGEYIVSCGGSVDGQIIDGICSGNYINGTEYETFTIMSTTTTVGNATGGIGGQRPGGNMGRPGGNMGRPDGDMGRPDGDMEMPSGNMERPDGGRR